MGAEGTLPALGSLGRGEDEAKHTRVPPAWLVPDSEPRAFFREDRLGFEMALLSHTLTARPL